MGYLVSLLADYGVHLPPKLFSAYGQQMAFYGDRWVAVASLPPEADLSRLPRSVGLVNIGVFVIVMLLTALLITGIRICCNKQCFGCSQGGGGAAVYSHWREFRRT